VQGRAAVAAAALETKKEPPRCSRSHEMTAHTTRGHFPAAATNLPVPFVLLPLLLLLRLQAPQSVRQGSIGGQAKPAH